MERIVVIGAGGLAEYLTLVADMNAAGAGLNLAGALDDDPALAGGAVHGVPVLGPLALARELPDCRFVFGIGSHRSLLRRKAILDGLGLGPERFVSLVHPSARLYAGARLGAGCVVHPYVVVFHEARIGDFVVVSPQCVIGGHCRLGQGALLASAVNLTSGVVVGPYAHLGAGALVAEGVRIGAGAQVGLGAVVGADVAPGTLVLGNPARALRRREVPADILALDDAPGAAPDEAQGPAPEGA
ncbi:acetyltransferase [Desulfocurvus vexinensis]|uniref:acetyltransferase n=1 Tax=Desulfocurvus vexinensis TaxID=399548 RepID=UPI0004B668D3|nr:acetyltransferase [Desulfocurvus vexinensis]